MNVGDVDDDDVEVEEEVVVVVRVEDKGVPSLKMMIGGVLLSLMFRFVLANRATEPRTPLAGLADRTDRTRPRRLDRTGCDVRNGILLAWF